jgi:hypothetical protein
VFEGWSGMMVSHHCKDQSCCESLDADRVGRLVREGWRFCECLYMQ